MSQEQKAAPLPNGTVIESYTIERVAEQGRYSISYLARESGRIVLLREFLPQDYSVRQGLAALAREPEDRNALRWWMRSFIDQAQQLAKLRHPALPVVHRVFEANVTAYAVSDPVAGETLEMLLQREGTVDESRLRRLLQPLLDGLEQAHAAGLLHRDIRPQNVIVRPDGSATLVDFAVLKAVVRLKSGIVSGAGVAPYAPLEELSINGEYGPWTDLYGLGALAYRAICGVAPPSAQQRQSGTVLIPAAQATRVRASDALLQAIDWALTPAAALRPQTVATWREALQAEPVDMQAAVASARAPAKRGGSGLLRIALPLLLLVLGGAGYWWFTQASTKPAADSPNASASVAPAAPVSASAVVPVPPPAAVATDAGDSKTSSLDQLALDLMSKDRKAQDAARDQKQQQDQHDKDERDRKAREAIDKLPKADAEPAPAKAPERPGRTAAPAAEDAAASARTRQLEEEIARLKSEKAQQTQDSDAARAAAREKAARDADAAAQVDRDRQAQIVAKARKNCRIPAPSLSDSGNLTFETAMRVPGAERTGSGSIRLPPVTTSDGDTRQFEITADSCARLVN